LDAFEVEKIVTELNGLSAYDYETQFLVENDCAASSEWYNCHNNMGFDFGSEGFKKHMLMKHGVENALCSEKFKEKARQTNLTNLGVEYPMQFLEFSENQQKSAKRISYYNDVLYYQGSYERHFLDYMSEKKLIGIIQRGFPISYSFEGVDRMHYPDFYIDDYNLIVEIKSDYYYNKYLNKNISRMNKCVEMGYNYIFVINKNYIPLNTILGIG
jgi:hypothetical protein